MFTLFNGMPIIIPTRFLRIVVNPIMGGGICLLCKTVKEFPSVNYVAIPHKLSACISALCQLHT